MWPLGRSKLVCVPATIALLSLMPGACSTSDVEDERSSPPLDADDGGRTNDAHLGADAADGSVYVDVETDRPPEAEPEPTGSIGRSLAAPTWEYQSSPVLTKGAPGKWDAHSAYNPRVVLTTEGTPYRDSQGDYYMYYTASDGSDGTDYDATGLALSSDLLSWTKVSVDAPVLPRGAPGSVDAGDASAVTVLHDGAMFHMWHEANATPPGVTTGDYVRIAYATSLDGKSWTKHGWVLEPGGSYDAQDVYAPAVVKDGSTWKMWYTGHDESGRFGVMHATAPNPSGPWTRAWPSFVFHPADDTFPSQVWKEGDTLYMTYAATPEGSPGSMWLAKMTGGVWVTIQNLSERRASGWDAHEPGSWPSVVSKDGLVYLFYGANVYYQGGIGYKTTPLLDAQ